MIGYGFFILIIALILFMTRREKEVAAKLHKLTIGILNEEKEEMIKQVEDSMNRVTQVGLEKIYLRKDFIEQSELATSWRQKHDRLEELNSDIERINANLTDANNQMSYELERGNEMISQLRDHLEKAYELNRENEMAIMDLLIKGKFPDEKGVYRKNYLSKNGEILPLGEYIDSLYCSKVTETNLDTKRNLVASMKMGLTLEDALRAKNDVIPYVIENEGGALQNMLDAVSNPSSHVFDFPNSIPKDEPLHDFEKIADQAMQPLAGAIDWTVPQAFPIDYYIPIDTNVIAIDSHEMVGKTTEKSTVPFCKWSSGRECIMSGHKLAPLNPTDHPLHPEFGKPTKDHPCLTGCSNKTNCTCSPADPRDGKALQVYTRTELIGMGFEMAIMNTKEDLQGEVEMLNEFALKNDLFYIGSNYGVTFNFYRKAKNEDFESWGKKDFSLNVTKQDIEIANPPAVAVTVNDFKLP